MAAAPAILLLLLSSLVGANYGSNLALFPAVTKDFYGLKNFGMNYGLVFTAWGIGGLTLSMFAAKVKDGSIAMLADKWAGSYEFAFYTSAVLLVVAGIMTFLVKAPHHHELAEA
jgi:OFA family oxalate/formate antiporter-like MFS transporter